MSRSTFAIALTFLLCARADARDYKIALAGKSFIWYNTDWQSWIEGRVERAVTDDRRFPSKSLNLRVVPVWGSGKFADTLQYLNVALSTDLFDAILLNVNAAGISRALLALEPWKRNS